MDLKLKGGSPVGFRYANFSSPITQNKTKQKTPSYDEAFKKKGDDILSHIIAVPSAQAGLTSLFGMGRGEPRRNNHLKSLVALGNCLQVQLTVNRTTVH